jgi:intein-like protein with splicing domain
MARAALGTPTLMPLISEVSYVPLIGGQAKPKKRIPYGFQPVPNGPRVKLARMPTPLEVQLLSLVEIPQRLDREVQQLTSALTMLRQSVLQDAHRLADISVERLTGGMLDLCAQSIDRTARYGSFELRQERNRQGGRYELSDDTSPAFDAIAQLVARLPRVQTVLRQRVARLTRDWLDDLADIEHRTLHAKRPDDWQALATRRLADGIKRTSGAIVNIGFAGGRAIQLAKNKEDSFEGEVMLMFTSVLDDSTCDECFLPSTKVTTSVGDVSIEHITAGMLILCDDNSYQQVLKVSTHHAASAVAITANGRTLRVTTDHPLWVGRSERWAWTRAADVRPGDSVVLDKSDDPQSEIVCRQHDGVWNSYRREPGRDSAFTLGLISDDDARLRVPVSTIDINDDIQARHEDVPNISAATNDRVLTHALNTSRSQCAEEHRFERRRSIKRHVTFSRTEAPSTDLGRRYTEHLSARFTRGGQYRPPTSLGAETPLWNYGRAEFATAPLAMVPSHVLALALQRADLVPAGVTSMSLERAPTQSTRHRDASASRRTVALHRTEAAMGRIAGTALARRALAAVSACDLALLVRDPFRASATRHGSGSGGIFLSDETRLSAPAASHGNFAMPLRQHHFCAVHVDAVEAVNYSGPVYDVTIAHRHTLIADGILTHNCEAADGTTFADGSDEADIMDVPYYKCYGGEACRCTIVEVGSNTDLYDHLQRVMKLRAALA